MFQRKVHEYLELVREGHGGQEDLPVQPKQVSSCTPGVTPDVEFRIHALKGSGQLLHDSVRSYFEMRFSQVRVHSDANAAQVVNARAFTVRQDVGFGAGQYTTGTTQCRIVFSQNNKESTAAETTAQSCHV